MSYSSAMTLPECYRILRVAPGEKWDEIKKSYHALALKCHPDHHPDVEGYESRFKDISRAFKALESLYRTAGIQDYEYTFDNSGGDSPADKFCSAELTTENQQRQNQQNFFRSILQRRVDKELVVDLKNQLHESLGLWEKKAFQLDVEKEIKIDSATVANGGMVKIRQEKESFEVPIPQGSWNRMTIRIPEKGEASWFRKRRGDLLLDVQVICPQSRVCDGDRNLYYDFPVSIEALKKGKMNTLKTAQGIIKFVLPRNAADGQTFILKAKPNTEEAKRTNHIVKILLG